MEISQKPPGKGVSPKERDSLISYLIGFIHAMCVCVCVMFCINFHLVEKRRVILMNKSKLVNQLFMNYKCNSWAYGGNLNSIYLRLFMIF